MNDFLCDVKIGGGNVFMIGTMFFFLSLLHKQLLKVAAKSYCPFLFFLICRSSYVDMFVFSLNVLRQFRRFFNSL